MAVISSPPKSLGWALSIPGILLTVCIWFLLSNAFEEVRKLAAFEQLEDALKEGKSEVASRDLRILGETRIATSLRQSFESLFVTLDQESESALLSSLVSSITATANDEFPKALRSVKIAARFVPEGSPFASSLEDFGATLENAARAYEEREKLEAELIELDRSGEKLKKSYLEIRDDLENFLGLGTQAYGKKKEYPFYESGILAGLPVVKGVPDDVRSGGDLRELLAALDAAVRVSSKNPKEEFDHAVSDLGDLSSEIRAPLKAYLRRREEIASGIRSNTLALSSVKEAIVQSLSPKLLANTEPTTSGFSKTLFEALRALGLA